MLRSTILGSVSYSALLSAATRSLERLFTASCHRLISLRSNASPPADAQASAEATAAAVPASDCSASAQVHQLPVSRCPCSQHLQAEVSLSPSTAAWRSQSGLRWYTSTGAESASGQEAATQDARAITRSIRDARTVQQLQDIIQQSASSFNAIHVSAAFSKAARLAGTAAEGLGPLLQRLVTAWQAVLPQATARELSGCLWACAKLGVSDPALWSTSIEAALHQLGPDANGQDLSNLAYSLAVITDLNSGAVPGVSRPQIKSVLGRITELLCVQLEGPAAGSVSVQSVSNILWACARLRVCPAAEQNETLLQAIAKAVPVATAPAAVRTSAAQAVANTLWAVSELQQLSQGSFKLQDPVWHQLLSQEQLQQLAAGGPHAISITLRALGTLATTEGHTLPVPFAQQCVLQLLKELPPRQVMCWTPVDIQAALWGCAKMGVKEETFMHAVAQAADQWVPAANATNVNHIAWACAKLRFKDERLIEALVHQGKQLMHGDRQHGPPSHEEKMTLAANLSWAVAVLNLGHLATDVKALLVSSGLRHMQEPLPGAIARMLWRVHVWLMHQHHMGGHGLSRLLTEQQLAACAAATRHVHRMTPHQQRLAVAAEQGQQKEHEN